METFPVENAALAGLRRRITLAQKLDVVAHRSRKEASTKEWFLTNALAVGVELDADNLERTKKKRRGRGAGAGDDEDDPDNSGVSRQTRQEDAVNAAMRGELKQLLSQPLVRKSVSRGFFTLNENLPTLTKAVDFEQLSR